TIPNPAPIGFANFARSIAASSGRVLIGAPGDPILAAIPGAAYLFSSATGSLLDTIPNPTGLNSQQFGFTVALMGNTAVVSAVGFGFLGFNGGVAYLFDVAADQLVRKFES